MREFHGEQFEGAPLFLNSATYGLPSRRVTEAVTGALRAWELGDLAPMEFDASVAAARGAFAAMAGVDAASVAMGGSVSELLGLVASALPDGTRVATFTGEFTSVTAPFDAQPGVTVTALEPGELERRAGEFDAVAVSLVQSSDGRVLDVAALRSSLGSTRVILDVTQAMGWMQLDVAWADVIVGGSYKWLLSPRGAAWMSVRDNLQLTANSAGWYSSETPWSNTYQLPSLQAPDARRFDSSPAWFTLLGAGIAMPWLASLDAAAVHAHCVGLANSVRSDLGLPLADSAILALDVPDAAARLAAAGIRAAVRAGRARVSFHLYNDESDVAALLAALR
ncbi:selenocysteine lyase/cysteine desulfurase [Microbacteriaceae bacterium SG_E_30_P1]|uniref:Selenocysteine lyase/cysteine desulfurase n=1 Tax=Antiquaquibacter oligotrophicus TaxID=2880260 RepID=A0ABT6KJ76_9MICO|nr:aminotransferase class V-fold PLP-dependent enzyme [Antiquaquibacter oligotrophicus]MDH6180033.1 selenocysteine lyase/cysteine desulfurase [Antiquaquibacter oligotrophicus]UDF14213.1 aminotransferase class V-fold PLP-dependent enzyme [Antiquaquibacter oligotrophicus]